MNRIDKISNSSSGLIGVAAAGMLVGAALNPLRKLLVQSVSAVSGDWLDMLKQDHQLTRLIFEKAEATSSSQSALRATLLMQLKHALAKHAMEEENVIYPALRHRGGDKEAADHLNHDHGYVKDYLYRLDETDNASPSWLTTLKEFRALFEKHVREEEDEIFPALRKKLSEDENRRLTLAANKEGLKVA